MDHTVFSMEDLQTLYIAIYLESWNYYAQIIEILIFMETSINMEIILLRPLSINYILSKYKSQLCYNFL
jgi:hypothetical protein